VGSSHGTFSPISTSKSINMRAPPILTVSRESVEGVINFDSSVDEPQSMSPAHEVCYRERQPMNEL